MDAQHIWRKCREFISGVQGTPAPGRMPARVGKPVHFELFTVIGADLRVDCGIASDGPVIVSGEVNGNITAPWVEVDDMAIVRGTVEADNAIIDGRVSGSVLGSKINLGGTARVGGEVVCERLNAEPGAIVEGRTFPSLRLNRALLRDLARIARDARAAKKVPDEALAILARDGLIFQRGGAVFVSIFGFLELNRRWTDTAGFTLSRTRLLDLEIRRPGPVNAFRRREPAINTPVSMIADDVKLDCDLDTGGDLHIHGDVLGGVRARHCRTGDASRIGGSVAARKASIAGHVDGDVSAESVVLHTTADVDGTVSFGSMDARGGAHYGLGRQVTGALPAFDTSLIGAYLQGIGKAA